MIAAVVVAAGRGTRMGPGEAKQLRLLGGRPVVVRALEAVVSAGLTEVVLAVPPGEEGRYRELAAQVSGARITVVAGGDTRTQSVALALEHVPAHASRVVVHDGARPLASARLFHRVLAAPGDAVIPALPLTDTVKRVSGARVVETLPREQLVRVQTPQAFAAPVLRRAHMAAQAGRTVATDDASLVEALGVPVTWVMGEPENVKITEPLDLVVAEALWRQRAGGRGGEAPVRVGFGYDVHPLVPGRALRLGGVEVPWERGLLGHSDGDVICHALMDALLGAMGQADLGTRFPPTDPALRGADSLQLLRQVRQEVEQSGWQVHNADVTLVAEAPRIAPYVAAMRTRLAEALGVPVQAVTVKATTNEGLGFLGRGEGMAAMAVVSLRYPAPGGGEGGGSEPGGAR